MNELQYPHTDQVITVLRPPQLYYIVTFWCCNGRNFCIYAYVYPENIIFRVTGFLDVRISG